MLVTAVPVVTCIQKNAKRSYPNWGKPAKSAEKLKKEADEGETTPATVPCGNTYTLSILC